jgi:hypothetical protein
VRGFHGPYASFQPIDQCKIVGSAAKQRLAEMNVCLYEAGNYGAVSGVDDRVGSVTCATDFRDPSVSDEDVALHHGVASVHRDERAVFDEDR